MLCLYTTLTVACDHNNFVLGLKAATENVHNSQVFSDVFQKVIEKFPEIEAVATMPATKYRPFAQEIVKADKAPIIRYKRPIDD